MIKATIQKDQIEAMKAKDTLRSETLRYILAQIKNKEIDKKTDLTEEETVMILRRQVKELEESIAAFAKGNRTDLKAEAESRRSIVTAYLPAELSDADLAQAVSAIVEKNQELYQSNPKAIIGICMKELRSQADASRIMKAIQEL